ncbi:MAG: hypothetical protein M3O70_20075, partial [Actinomycetota bacterium]|nr:hypothetical protein [Actinomycetota bacterium]
MKTFDAEQLLRTSKAAQQALDQFKGVTIDVGQLLNDQVSRLARLELLMSEADPVLVDEDKNQLSSLGLELLVAALESQLLRWLALSLAGAAALDLTGADQTLVLILEMRSFRSRSPLRDGWSRTQTEPEREPSWPY